MSEQHLTTNDHIAIDIASPTIPITTEPNQLAASTGRDGYQLFHQIAGRYHRFPLDLRESEIEHQTERRDKMLEKLTFDLFRPKTEKELEDWVDKASKLVTRYRAAPVLFQEALRAWKNPSSRAHARIPLLKLRNGSATPFADFIVFQ